MSTVNDARREFLIQALTAGVFAAGASMLSSSVNAMGKIPRQLPPGKSIYDMSGRVRVDGEDAATDTLIKTGSTVETGEDSHVIFVVAKDAFILRSNSKVEIEGDDIIQTLRILSGKLLSVFGRRAENARPVGVKTVAATIGIRGTGIYVEADADRSYVCTCYGVADLAAVNDSNSRETVVTRHHDAPRYIMAQGDPGELILPAPVINHTDDELVLIETLVGRTVPFAAGGGYSGPRKPAY